MIQSRLASRRARPTLRRSLPAALIAACWLVLAACGSVAGPTYPLAAARTPVRPQTRAPAWLGVNYNSSSAFGLRQLARLGIVYDRDGGLETTAGQSAGPGTELGRALTRSYGAGMIPDVLVDVAHSTDGCTSNPAKAKLCLPTGSRQIEEYAGGFVATVRSVLRQFPGRTVLFEPMDEPWNWAAPPGTPSGRQAATEYARALVAIFDDSRRQGLDLARYYIPATGPLADGSSWIPDLYAAEPCLRPGPRSCGPIQGWNVHPYGRPQSRTQGIRALPGLRDEMRSGRDNIIVSEIGFCATDIDHGSQCDENDSDLDGTSAQTAHWMSGVLRQAAVMHRAGWLRALIVWARDAGGWAVESANGRLTSQGESLVHFAASAAGRGRGVDRRR